MKTIVRWLVPGRRGTMALSLVLVALGVAVFVPDALAFPYRASIGSTTIYSEQPIDPSIGTRLARADALLAASPINVAGIDRTIVLTDGGWRWRVLSIGVSGAIAFRRPLTSTLIFNRSDIAADRVTNGAPLGGVRTLSGTIAHETMHMLITRHFGLLRSLRFPIWKTEGYADYVARYPHAPVLVYYEGRRRVSAALRANGGSVDRLFE